MVASISQSFVSVCTSDIFMVTNNKAIELSGTGVAGLITLYSNMIQNAVGCDDVTATYVSVRINRAISVPSRKSI